MNFNPFIGRQYRSPDENESIDPDPMLTVAVVIFCILGPFWLIYRFFEYVATRVGLFTRRAPRLIK